MAVQSQAELLERIERSTKRLQRVRQAAETLRDTERAFEPAPEETLRGVTSATPSFRGEPQR